MFAHCYPDTGNGAVLSVLLHAVEHGFLPCTVGCMRKDSIKRSPGTRWLAMVLKAMKIAKRQSAVKKVDTAKSEVMQKNKAKAHKVKQRPEKMDVVTQEEHEKEQEEKQQEEEEGECQEDDEKDRTKVSGKEYNFPKSLPEAPMAVQEARSGKEKQLPRAYANQKSVESLQRKDIVTPKVVMVAKCGGKSAFEQAACLVNLNVL